MSQDGRSLVLIPVVLTLLVLGGWWFYSCARFNECRETHPTWYCVGSD